MLYDFKLHLFMDELKRGAIVLSNDQIENTSQIEHTISTLL